MTVLFTLQHTVPQRQSMLPVSLAQVACSQAKGMNLVTVAALVAVARAPVMDHSPVGCLLAGCLLRSKSPVVGSLLAVQEVSMGHLQRGEMPAATLAVTRRAPAVPSFRQAREVLLVALGVQSQTTVRPALTAVLVAKVLLVAPRVGRLVMVWAPRLVVFQVSLPMGTLPVLPFQALKAMASDGDWERPGMERVAMTIPCLPIRGV